MPRRIAVLQPLLDCESLRSAGHVVRAAHNLGVEAALIARSEDVREYSPDFVLVMSHQEPKLTPFPTYGVLESSWLDYQTPRFIRNILSYDAYFTMSVRVREWLEDITFGARKLAAPVGFFGSTAPSTTLDGSEKRRSEIAYIASDEGAEYRKLLWHLARKPYMRMLGATPGRPRHLARRQSRNDPACDEKGLPVAFRKSLAALCLDRHQNCGNRQPSSQLFEIVASGAVCICTKTPFVERWFGDSVLYLEPDAPVDVQLWQLDRYMKWLAADRRAVSDLARRAHAAFVKDLAIERILPGVFELHEKVVREKGHVRVGQPDEPTVTYVLRTEGAPERTLRSLRTQHYPRLRVIVVPIGNRAGLDALAEEYADLRLRILPSPAGTRSTALWRGLAAVREDGPDFFGLVEDCDELFPNHVRTLVRTLTNLDDRTWFSPFGIAYGGCVESAATSFSRDRIPDDESLPGARKLRVRQFHFYHACQLDRGVHENHAASFLARTAMLDDEVLQDPLMDEGAEDYLQLLFAEKSLFAFSCEVTSVVHDRPDSASERRAPVELKGSRLRTFFRTFGRSFPSATIYMHNVIFQTRFDDDLVAPVIYAQHTGEVGRPIQTPTVKLAGGSTQRGRVVRVPNRIGATATLASMRLAPGRYTLRCYFTAPESDDPSLPILGIDAGGDLLSAPVEISESMAGRSGDVRIASVEFEVTIESSRRPAEIRFRSVRQGGFELLGTQLYRVTRVVRHSLLDLPSDKPIWIYGAGEGGRIMKRKLDLLGIKIAGFVDKFKTGFLEDLPIIGLKTATKVINEDTTLIIASIFWQEIREELRRQRISANLYSGYPYAGDLVYALE